MLFELKQDVEPSFIVNENDVLPTDIRDAFEQCRVESNVLAMAEAAIIGRECHLHCAYLLRSINRVYFCSPAAPRGEVQAKVHRNPWQE